LPKKRPRIPKKTADELLVKCKHSCCMCEKFGVEIHHIDGNPSNNREDNLIPLCSNCANFAHVDFPSAARTHGISQDQLRLYKKNWIEKCNSFNPTVADDIREVKQALSEIRGEIRKLWQSEGRK
jgi:hypothetical protein